MRVALINSKDSIRGRYILDQMDAGCRAHGDETQWLHQADSKPERVLQWLDVGVSVCYRNKKFENHLSPGKRDQGTFRALIDDTITAQGKRLVTIDTGFVKNQTEVEMEVAQRERHHSLDFNKAETYAGCKSFDLSDQATFEAVQNLIHYEIGFDGLKRHADYCNANVPGDRWEKLEKLGVALKPWRAGTSGQHILLMGQTLFGQSSQHVNIYDWYRTVCLTIRARSDREIRFRHHPRILKLRGDTSRAHKDRPHIEEAMRGISNWSYTDNFLLTDALTDCWAAVVFTSNACVTSVIEGVPTFVGDAAAMAWEIANHDVRKIEEPICYWDRQTWANRLAYAQWNCAEMRSGECWAHLRPHAMEPRKVPMA